jgi:hypothetical protein
MASSHDLEQHRSALTRRCYRMMMTTVLRILRHTDLVAQLPALDACREAFSP